MHIHHSMDLLGEIFGRHFSVILADAEAERERVFDLRFRVFCEELGFAMKNRNGLESDDYDNSSLHCLIHHNPSHTDVGCVRLVLPGERGGGLPFEKFGLRYVDRTLLDWRKLDPTRCCEISRLAVLDEFRRPLKVFDATANANNVSAFVERRQTPRRMPPVALALYQAMVALTLHHQFEHTFMVGEPRLQRHLASYNITMHQISPTFEYFGQRAVFVTTRADCEATVESWNADKRDLYRFVYQSLTGSLPPTSDAINRSTG